MVWGGGCAIIHIIHICSRLDPSQKYISPNPNFAMTTSTLKRYFVEYQTHQPLAMFVCLSLHCHTPYSWGTTRRFGRPCLASYVMTLTWPGPETGESARLYRRASYHLMPEMTRCLTLPQKLLSYCIFKWNLILIKRGGNHAGVMCGSGQLLSVTMEFWLLPIILLFRNN